MTSKKQAKEQIAQPIEKYEKVNKQGLGEANTPAYARKDIGRQIGVEDAVQGRLVYELYGLTEEEVGIVEGR